MFKAENIIFLLTGFFFIIAVTSSADAIICFEAEDAFEFKNPVKTVTVKDKNTATKISKGKFIEIIQGAGGGTKAGGFAKYKLNLPENGTYYLWARCWWLDCCGNSFSVKIADKPLFTFGNDATYKTWHWVKAKVKLKLKKGPCVLLISNREDGIKIDQIMLTNDRKVVPVGIEADKK